MSGAVSDMILLSDPSTLSQHRHLALPIFTSNTLDMPASMQGMCRRITPGQEDSMKGSTRSLWAHRQAILVVPLLLALLAWATPAHAANFTVDWPYDEFDMNPGDGACVSTPSGGCTLRAALQEAEAAPASAHTITFGVGFTSYQLIYGDLYIVASTTRSIVGNGGGQTVISSEGSDRIIEIGPGASLALYKVTLIGGRAKGKMFNDYRFHAHGGAIHNHGSLTLVDSTVTTNSSAPGWGGGGITNANGTADLVNVTLADNTTPANGGGL